MARASLLNFSFSYARPIASKLQWYIPEDATLRNCQCDVFWPIIAIIIATFLKKTAAEKRLWYAIASY